MEVKPGYKQTEVGVIPEDWDVSPFSGLFNITAGGDVDPKRSQTFQDATHCHPIYSNALTKSGLYGYCSYADHPADSITITARGMVGGANFRDHPYTAIGRVLVLQPKSDLAGFYFAEVINNRVKFANESTGVPQLTAPQISKYRLPVPPLPEQRAIATALGDVDALLGALNRLIAKKRDLKQAATQQLLTGQTRLPGFAPQRQDLQHTELGYYPADWKVEALRRLVDPNRSIRYGIVQPGQYDSRGRLMIRGQDYSKGWVEPAEMFRVSDLIEERYRNARVQSGDLIITIVGAGTGTVETIPAWLDGANLTQTTARIAINSNEAHSEFCKHVLQTKVGKRQVANFIKGGAQPGLNCGDIVKFVLPMPASVDEQTAIAEVLSDMDAELSSLEQRREKTRDLKEAMMQELLTGKTRLVSPEETHA